MPHTPIHLRRFLAAITLILAGALAAPALAQSEAEASSDANVDALASQLQGKSGLGLSSLQLSGFADFSFAKYFFTKESGASAFFGEHGAFSVGNINLYLDAQLSQRARSLVEVRFTYLPNGNGTLDMTTMQLTRENYTAADYNDLYRNVNLGSIIIERAWVEYRLDEKLTLRAGHFLTPYGIWNVDHGSPVIVGVLRPFVIGQQLIPEAQVGLEGYGSFHLGSSLLAGYHLTLSNGRIGTHGEYLAPNGKPGVGGRFFVESNALGTLRLGASGYTGRYTDANYAYSMAGVTKVTTLQYDEWSAAADVHWDYKLLLLNAEFVRNTIHYRAGNPVHADLTPIDNDYRAGLYVLAGVRLPFYEKLMPFGMYEFFRTSDALRHEGGMNNDIYKYTAGLNYHLQPNLVIKAQYDWVKHRGQNPVHMVDDSTEVLSQVAWAF